ncbi:hypothetical protein EIP91_005441 [Steccherinum ochraceum]|uniref:Uncharacterized protein n=1 Tax=Steccherinum ochraceum TaxID=92696 RepID=A0A4R0RXG4_9APHY|nr:hypothetical protein EIP91_005441 [Steccherinum ochraceum]
MVEAGSLPPPNPAFVRRVKVQRQRVVKARISRRRRLTNAQVKSMAFTCEDVDMIDLTLDSVPSKRPGDENYLPPPKKVKPCPSGRQRQARRRKSRRETYVRRRLFSRMRRDQIFLEELIADANGASSSSKNGFRDADPDQERIKRMRNMNAREATNSTRNTHSGGLARDEVRSQSKRGGTASIPNPNPTPSQRKRQKYTDDPSWSQGDWTPQRAFQWYLHVSHLFDSAKFSPSDPLTFADIPWPILSRPGSYAPQDITWSAVEAFFAALKADADASMGVLDEYKKLVEKSHKRFHPDRWRARRVWLGVPEGETKDALEAAANVVAQALTPIWRDIKS